MKNGWQTKKISEIAKYSLGKMLDKAKNKGELKPYLRNFNVRWFDFDLTDVLEMRFLPEEAAKYTAVKGDVLICEGGYPGRAAIWDQDEPIYFQKALHRVRFYEPDRSRWFLYYLYAKDLDGTLKNHFNGAGIQHFTGEALAQFEVPLPPLPKQRRIVCILDEAFDGIATAKANAEKSLQNARAIFEVHLRSVFAQRGKGWKQKPLRSLCELISGQHIDAKDYNTDGKGVGYLTGPSDFSFTSPVVTKWTEHPKRMAKRGDILVTVKGSGVGKINLLDVEEVAISRQLMAVRATAGDASYLYAFLSTNFGYFQSLSKGAAIPGISREDVLDLMCPMPPPGEQQTIVKLIHSVAEETQRLANVYERKLTALAALKKSLLHDAFTGAL